MKWEVVTWFCCRLRISYEPSTSAPYSAQRRKRERARERSLWLEKSVTGLYRIERDLRNSMKREEAERTERKKGGLIGKKFVILFKVYFNFLGQPPAVCGGWIYFTVCFSIC